jgi:nucleotide-binding universal stress UspA family protein
MADTEGRIVVGIDGSEPASRALSWAAEYGQLTGAPLLAVSAWTVPASYGYDLVARDWDVEGAAREVATRQVSEVSECFPGLEIDLAVEFGHPSQVLVDASRGARLLVVGNRGHGGFADMLLGSVSTHCVHAALCPVLVVRPGVT